MLLVGPLLVVLQWSSSYSLASPAAAVHAAPGLGRRGPAAAARRWVGRGAAAAADGAVADVAAAAGGAAAAPGFWPRGDALDKRILLLALPAVANLFVLPLVGTALAALGAANQVFQSIFVVVSFLPSVVTPLVASANAAGDAAVLRQRVQDAAFVSAVIGACATLAVAGWPAQALRAVLPATASAATRGLATEYLFVRALALVPAMLAFVGFATFRGLLDVATPLRVTLATQSINAVLDPICIFALGMGVRGAAVATGVAEVAAAAAYGVLLAKKGIIGGLATWRPPSAASLAPLLAGVVLFAMSAVAAILVPATINAPDSAGGGAQPALAVADRMLGWGAALGAVLAMLQLAALPLLGVFTPVAAVRDAARAPAVIGAVLQLLNGVTFVGEGIMQGHRAFFPLARNSFFASAALILSIRRYGDSLTGIWLSFGIFNGIRFAGAMRHHLYTGPLAAARREAREARAA
ncbi:hypothetical protein M885DRAFT_500080 [Pelagophyceae sp. CCMP2097]|nr:hypothetical protein M885DRAFT_500080 [Pelagophyceae sp. CCMP2097]